MRCLNRSFFLTVAGLALLVDSDRRMRPLHPMSALGPFLLALRPKESFEWYLGILFILTAVWLFRQSKADPEIDRSADDRP